MGLVGCGTRECDVSSLDCHRPTAIGVLPTGLAPQLPLSTSRLRTSTVFLDSSLSDLILLFSIDPRQDANRYDTTIFYVLMNVNVL